MATRPPEGTTAILTRDPGWRAIRVSIRPERGRRLAPDKRQILAPKIAGPPMICKLRGQPTMSSIGLGDNHQAACVFVQAVDDARPRNAADARKAVPAVSDKRIDESTVGISRARMHNQSSRFVDNNKALIFINDVQRNLFARDA